MPKQTYYEILGVQPNALLVDIKRAYRQLAHKFHPDRHNSANKTPEIIEAELKERTSRMALYNAIYAILSDEVKRKEYDRSDKVDFTSTTANNIVNEAIYTDANGNQFSLYTLLSTGKIDSNTIMRLVEGNPIFAAYLLAYQHIRDVLTPFQFYGLMDIWISNNQFAIYTENDLPEIILHSIIRCRDAKNHMLYVAYDNSSFANFLWQHRKILTIDDIVSLLLKGVKKDNLWKDFVSSPWFLEQISLYDLKDLVQKYDIKDLPGHIRLQLEAYIFLLDYEETSVDSKKDPQVISAMKTIWGKFELECLIRNNAYFAKHFFNLLFRSKNLDFFAYISLIIKYGILNFTLADKLLRHASDYKQYYLIPLVKAHPKLGCMYADLLAKLMKPKEYVELLQKNEFLRMGFLNVDLSEKPLDAYLTGECIVFLKATGLDIFGDTPVVLTCLRRSKAYSKLLKILESSSPVVETEFARLLQDAKVSKSILEKLITQKSKFTTYIKYFKDLWNAVFVSENFSLVIKFVDAFPEALNHFFENAHLLSLLTQEQRDIFEDRLRRHLPSSQLVIYSDSKIILTPDAAINAAENLAVDFFIEENSKAGKDENSTNSSASNKKPESNFDMSDIYRRIFHNWESAKKLFLGDYDQVKNGLLLLKLFLKYGHGALSLIITNQFQDLVLAYIYVEILRISKVNSTDIQFSDISKGILLPENSFEILLESHSKMLLTQGLWYCWLFLICYGFQLDKPDIHQKILDFCKNNFKLIEPNIENVLNGLNDELMMNEENVPLGSLIIELENNFSRKPSSALHTIKQEPFAILPEQTDALAALTKNVIGDKNVILYGSPGIGKSAMVRHLVRSNHSKFESIYTIEASDKKTFTEKMLEVAEQFGLYSRKKGEKISKINFKFIIDLTIYFLKSNTLFVFDLGAMSNFNYVHDMLYASVGYAARVIIIARDYRQIGMYNVAYLSLESKCSSADTILTTWLCDKALPNTISSLTRALEGYYPAIVIAASVINQMGYSVRDYLNKLANEPAATLALSTNDGDAITKLFDKELSMLQSESQSALDFLYYLVFLTDFKFDEYTSKGLIRHLFEGKDGSVVLALNKMAFFDSKKFEISNRLFLLVLKHKLSLEEQLTRLDRLIKLNYEISHFFSYSQKYRSIVPSLKKQKLAVEEKIRLNSDPQSSSSVASSRVAPAAAMYPSARATPGSDAELLKFMKKSFS